MWEKQIFPRSSCNLPFAFLTQLRALHLFTSKPEACSWGTLLGCPWDVGVLFPPPFGSVDTQLNECGLSFQKASRLEGGTDKYG